MAITDRCKVVEAYLHNDNKITGDKATGNKATEEKETGEPERMTIVYKGLGSFTFHLKPMKTLEQKARWDGTINGKMITCQL